MSSPVVTPPAAPAPVSTPAAAVAAPAPASVPSPAPVADASPAAVPDLGGASVAEYLSAGLTEARAEVDAASKAEDAAAAKPPEAAAVPAVDVKTEDPKPAVEAKVEDPAEVVADPAVAAADAAKLDLSQPIAPSALATALAAAPKEVKDWLDSPGQSEFKKGLFAMARESEQARPILRKIPTVEVADDLIATSSRFSDFDDSFNAINSLETGQQFLQKAYEDFAIVGEDGKKTANPSFAHFERAAANNQMQYLVGKAKETGVMHPVLDAIIQDVLDIYENKAKTDPDGLMAPDLMNADVLTAVQTLRDAAKVGAPSKVELTPEQKRQQADLDRRQSEADARDKSTKDQGQKDHATKVENTTKEAYKASIKSVVDQFVPVLKAAGLTQFEVTNASRAIGDELKAQLDQNLEYKRRGNILKAAIARNPTEASQKALTNHEISFQQPLLADIVSKVMREATAGRAARLADVDTKIAGQVEQSKADPQGVSTATPGGAVAMTADQEYAADAAEWLKLNPNAGPMPPAFHISRSMKRDALRP